MKIIKPIFLLFFVLSTIVFASSFSFATPFPFNNWYGTNSIITANFIGTANSLIIYNSTATNTISLTLPTNTLTNAYLFVNNIEVGNTFIAATASNSIFFVFNSFGVPSTYSTTPLPSITTNGNAITTGNYAVGTYTFNVMATNGIVPNSPIGQSLSLFTSNIPTSNTIASANSNVIVNPALLSLQLSVLPSNSYTYNSLVPTIKGTLTATTGNIFEQPSVNSITIQLQNTTSNTPYYSYNAFNTIATPTSSNTFIFPSLANFYSSASTYVFNALISGSNENYSISSSTKNTLTIGNTLVISSNSLLAPSYVFSNSSGSAFLNQKGQWVSPYYTLDAFKFTGAPTFNNQIKWNLYVNSGLSKTNTSVIKWATQGSPGTYTLTFSNAGNSNYTGNSITETLIVQQPASGSVSSSPPPVVITTTIPVTTTIPRIVKHIVNISTSSYNSLLNISTTPFTLNYSNENIILKLTSNSLTGINTTIAISNATSIAKNMTNKNYTKLAAFNFNSSQNISINATYTYNCNLNNVSAFELVNNSWTKISSVVNASACTLSFAIPSDPIIGIFSYKPIAVSTTTTSTTTSTVPSNVVTTTAPITTVSNITNTTTTVPVSPVSSTSHSTLVIIAIIVIIIIIIAAVAYLMKKKK